MTPDKTPTNQDLLPLIKKHLGLEAHRDGLVIERRTGRFHDVRRYQDFAADILAKWGSPVVAGEPQPSAEGPPELWLQLHGDCAEPELSEPVDYTAGDVTWCWHSIHDSDVRYVRADLATTPQPTQAQAGAVPLTPEQCNDLLAASFCIASVGDPDATIKPEDAERIITLLHSLGGIKEGGQHAD